VQRVGRRLVLSAGIARGEQKSQLVVIDMGSRAERGPWGLPRYAADGHSYKAPAAADRVIQVTTVDHHLWHAGGIQAAEGIVGVPVYAPAAQYSEVHFYDCTCLPPLRVSVLVKPHLQAKAVGLLRWDDQRWLAAVWDEKAPHRLHLQFSRTPRLEDGFEEPRLVHREFEPLQFRPSDSLVPGSYQSLNLVRDTLDGGLYFIASRNVEQASPFVPGDDRLDLFRVRWDPGDPAGPVRVEHVAGKQMYCYDQQCNFGGAAGIYTEDDEHLWLYAAAHYLHDGNQRANFNEFACRC
jgi:hypothetical protein